MVQSGAGSVSYTGSWGVSSGSGALGGGTTYSTRPGASANFSFSGREVAWVAPRSPGGGTARVLLDGRSLGTVDLSRSTLQPRRLVLDRLTSSGSHTLRITVIEGRVDIDAFLVIG